ncbi:Crp/Fnr family transcriptional regulator [Microbulbifer sp.]|uniref:Crp/Fnr family transcriptional regulator n=1 Tax=Microbulbifer sp. TaxID=1908541 RepID=UPI003F31B20D
MRQVDGEILLDELGIDHLKNASALGALSDQTIAYLMKKGRVYALRKGETLFEDGAAGDTFFIILKGSFAYYLPSNNHSKYIREFNFGMEIGFVSMIALIPRPGTAIASSDSYVLEVTTDLFYALHYERPLDFGVLLINLCRELARRILERQKRNNH